MNILTLIIVITVRNSYSKKGENHIWFKDTENIAKTNEDVFIKNVLVDSQPKVRKTKRK